MVRLVCFISETSAPSSVFADSSSRSSCSPWWRGWRNLAFRLARRFSAWLRGPPLDATSLTAGILFYRRLAQLLAALRPGAHVRRRPRASSRVRAHKFLTGQGPLTQPVADVPRQVVDAFYRVRFGHLELEPASLEELDARLDALETSLKSPDVRLDIEDRAMTAVDLANKEKEGCVSESSGSQAAARARCFSS